MTKTTNKYSPEVRERAVRMVLDGTGQHRELFWALVDAHGTSD
jgi:transposase-like protein